jgi:hypothetical protein
MKAPAGGLISLFSRKMDSFFGTLCASATSHNTYTFKQTEGYRCFNDLIGQESFEEIEGSILGTSAASSAAFSNAPLLSLSQPLD